MDRSASLEAALLRLPHGAEFRFIDRLLSLVPGRSGTAEYAVRGDEPFLRGHFPGEPIFPAVLLIEAAAQLAGAVAQSDPEILPLEGLKLTAVRNAKIFGTARPGEKIRIEAHIRGRLGHLIQATALALVSGRQILTAELTLAGENKVLS